MNLCNCFGDNWILIAIIVLMLIFLCDGGCETNYGGRGNNCDCGC